MKAIEFETQTRKGIIKIPKEYKELANAYVKIIILAEERDVKLEKKRKIKQLLKKIKTKKIFETIVNPSIWQKELRGEWK